MNLVSIIIPYYKKRKFIKSAVISAIKQSYRKIEIIIIYDDQDKTDLNYIKKITKLDRRIKLLINSKNIGAGYSRNKGIKFSKGQYIAFLDSDDFWFKEKLKYQINFMKKKNCSFSHTSYFEVNIKNKKIIPRKAKNYIRFGDLLKSCNIGLSTVVLKKKTFSKNLFFPNLKTKEDYVLWLNLSKSGIDILGIKKYLSKWNKVENSLSSNSIQKLIDGFRVYKNHLKFNFFKSIYYLVLLSINFLKKNI